MLAFFEIGLAQESRSSARNCLSEIDRESAAGGYLTTEPRGLFVWADFERIAWSCLSRPAPQRVLV